MSAVPAMPGGRAAGFEAPPSGGNPRKGKQGGGGKVAGRSSVTWVVVLVREVEGALVVNGLYLYSALQYCLTLTHSCTHSHADGGVNDKSRPPARREQLGLGALLRDTATLS